MARLDLFSVEGFESLNKKLKILPDRVKRNEILKIQRQLAKPIQRTYAQNLPVDRGTLSRSVAIKTVSVRRSKGNPIINVVPGRRGRNDAYYKLMVIPKGAKLRNGKRGSRKGLNTVTPDARDRTLEDVEGDVVDQSEKKVGAYVQKQILRLSR